MTEEIKRTIEVLEKCKPWVVSNKHSAKDMFEFQQALSTAITYLKKYGTEKNG